MENDSTPYKKFLDMEERLERCEKTKKEYQTQNFNLSQENIRLRKQIEEIFEELKSKMSEDEPESNLFTEKK